MGVGGVSQENKIEPQLFRQYHAVWKSWHWLWWQQMQFAVEKCMGEGTAMGLTPRMYLGEGWLIVWQGWVCQICWGHLLAADPGRARCRLESGQHQTEPNSWPYKYELGLNSCSGWCRGDSILKKINSDISNTSVLSLLGVRSLSAWWITLDYLTFDHNWGLSTFGTYRFLAWHFQSIYLHSCEVCEDDLCKKLGL